MRRLAAIIFLACSVQASAGNAPALSQLSSLEIRAEEDAPFDRWRDFGGWSAVGGDPICLDVRGQILARASLWPVTTSLPVGSRCEVKTGYWVDPYTNAEIFNARAMDVDHLVPLKEAWRSGAWRWTRAARRAYANDVANLGHLVAVSAVANRSKGDRDPAKWLPPSLHFRCRYLELWVEIKVRWNLTIDPTEAATIRDGLGQC